MFHTSFKFRLGVLTCGILAICLARAAAEDKKDATPALKGTWAKKAGEMTIEFEDKDVMKLSPHGANKIVVIICKFSINKEGVLKAKITDLEGKAKEQAKATVPIGLEFTVNWKAKNDSATMDDVKGENTDTLKAHLEGDYELKK